VGLASPMNTSNVVVLLPPADPVPQSASPSGTMVSSQRFRIQAGKLELASQ